MNLFEKLPDNFFSILSSKNKSIYALALLSLYESLLSFKTTIRKSDFVSLLKAKNENQISLFELESEDDNYEGIEINFSAKANYILKKIVDSGWVEVVIDNKTGVEFLYLPAYSIKMLSLLSTIVKDNDYYLPLVHATFSELKLEDENEDDFMYKSLTTALRNTRELELSVTLLHHSIRVFGKKLSKVFTPNDVLKQHFDDFRIEVGDKIYHPLKTFDSLGLYCQPTVKILRSWSKDNRIMEKLVLQAKLEPSHSRIDKNELHELIISQINEIIDIYSKLSKAFEEIDLANSDYTKNVQKKINFLSSNDKTIKGKLDTIFKQVALVSAHLDGNISGDNIYQLMEESIHLSRLAIIDSDSLAMPFKRKFMEELEPLSIEDEISEFDDSFTAYLDDDVARYGDEAVENFIIKVLGKNEVVRLDEFVLKDIDELILLILAIVKANLITCFYEVTKIQNEEIVSGHYLLPLYEIKRRKDYVC